jgi:hypothetical protein
MPGPLFNISAYLGALAAARAGVNALVGVAACWVGMFAPGVLVVFGTLPFWGEVSAPRPAPTRTRPRARPRAPARHARLARGGCARGGGGSSASGRCTGARCPG